MKTIFEKVDKFCLKRRKSEIDRKRLYHERGWQPFYNEKGYYIKNRIIELILGRKGIFARIARRIGV